MFHAWIYHYNRTCPFHELLLGVFKVILNTIKLWNCIYVLHTTFTLKNASFWFSDLFSNCPSSTEFYANFSPCVRALYRYFPIICHRSLSPFDWLINWLHNYWDDYWRRHWCNRFIFINKVNNITVATLSVTTWTDWCHLNSVLPHGRLTLNHMRFFRTSARHTFTGEVTLLQSILSKLRVLK